MKLTQKIFEVQEPILVGEHPSGTRVGGWHGGALFEWNEFAQPSIFVSFYAMKKESPRQGREKGSLVWQLRWQHFLASLPGAFFFLR